MSLLSDSNTVDFSNLFALDTGIPDPIHQYKDQINIFSTPLENSLLTFI